MPIARRVCVVFLCALILYAGVVHSTHPAIARNTDNAQSGSPTGLTIYNQQFAVVRQTLPLDLKAGVNHVDVTDITGHLEPDSVILRSLDAGRRLQIIEQNYRNDPVTQQLLLSLYEGKTIDFVLPGKQTVQGKIIRSGFVPHSASAYSIYGQQYYQAQASYAQSGGDQPIIEVNGKLQFSLPGQPIFPALINDTVLQPTLSWELQADQPGALKTEFSYVTQGMNWGASYNVVAPPKGNLLELVGWVTLDNQSGKTFRNAHINLMAGDVNKLQPANGVAYATSGVVSNEPQQFTPPVTERAFDEYHLYTLEQPTSLHDRETKQVEFVRAAGIQSKTVYVYDGFRLDPSYRNWSIESIRQQESFGILSNPKVWVMQEFENSSGNQLGMPLPKG
jgi:hypothetical protein